jgi:isopenicillin N synthase-like dioxygenase
VPDQFVAQPCELHADVGVTTVACLSSAKTGLQLFDFTAGAWVDFEGRIGKHQDDVAPRTLLVVFFGDMAEFHSGGLLCPSQHRVVMPSSVREPRISVIAVAIPYPAQRLIMMPPKLQQGNNFPAPAAPISSNITGAQQYLALSCNISSVNWADPAYDGAASM